MVNIAGKGENACYKHFLLFPRFQKAYSSEASKFIKCSNKQNTSDLMGAGFKYKILLNDDSEMLLFTKEHFRVVQI